MKKMSVLLLFSTIALAGCGHAFFPLGEALNSMHGMPKEQVFKDLGMPNQVHEIDGITVYVWQYARDYQSLSYQEVNVRGGVGRTPYNTRVSGYVPKTEHQSCTITVGVKDGIVINTDFMEENFGCVRYRERLYKK